MMIGRIGSIHVRDGGLKQWPLGFHVHHSNGSHKNLNDEKKTLRLKAKGPKLLKNKNKIKSTYN